MTDETVDRHEAFRAAMRQVETPLNRSGLKREPQNNRSPYSTYNNSKNYWYANQKKPTLVDKR
jgi:hypothetical protein